MMRAGGLEGGGALASALGGPPLRDVALLAGLCLALRPELMASLVSERSARCRLRRQLL